MKDILIFKAKALEVKEKIMGYYYYDGLDHIIVCSLGNHWHIKPETLQVQLTNGEFAPVDDVEVVRKNRKVNVKLEDWDETCGDGCCDTYGTSTTVDNEELFCQNQDRATILEEVLKHLGFDAVVVED